MRIWRLISISATKCQFTDDTWLHQTSTPTTTQKNVESLLFLLFWHACYQFIPIRLFWRESFIEGLDTGVFVWPQRFLRWAIRLLGKGLWWLNTSRSKTASLVLEANYPYIKVAYLRLSKTLSEASYPYFICRGSQSTPGSSSLAACLTSSLSTEKLRRCSVWATATRIHSISGGRTRNGLQGNTMVCLLTLKVQMKSDWQEWH